MMIWSHISGLKMSNKEFFTEYQQCCIFDYTNQQSQDLIWSGFLNFTFSDHLAYTSLLWHVWCTDPYLAGMDVWTEWALPTSLSEKFTCTYKWYTVWLEVIILCDFMFKTTHLSCRYPQNKNISMLFCLPIQIWSNPLNQCVFYLQFYKDGNLVCPPPLIFQVLSKTCGSIKNLLI